jgi:heme/copper-type cytochrome/quinol oxidase subunit 2
MDKRYVILVLVAILLVLGIALWFSRGPVAGPAGGPAAGTNTSPTKAAVGSDAIVPDGKGQAPEGVATPQSVIAAAPGTNAKLRVFNLVFEKNTVTPGAVSVHAGDTVQINFTAKDGTYDFTQPDLGFSLKIPAGATKLVEFSTPSPARYLFYCASCGGPEKGPAGYIYVVPVK